jgi:hypothetical protein
MLKLLASADATAYDWAEAVRVMCARELLLHKARGKKYRQVEASASQWVRT